LGVDQGLIAARGAVSKEVAEAMASGAVARLPAGTKNGRIAVSVTGIAGPDGGTPEKPVGLVHFGLAILRPGSQHAEIRHEERRFGDLGRAKIREKSVETALSLLFSGLTS
jgi:nicotinamide-nucleotide amidase